MLILIAAGVQAQAAPGCMRCLPHSDQCSTNKTAADDVRNFAHINLACVTPFADFRHRIFEVANGDEARWQLFRKGSVDFCYCVVPNREMGRPANQADIRSLILFNAFQ